MRQQNNQENPDTTGSPIPDETEEALRGLGTNSNEDNELGFFRTVGGDIANFGRNAFNNVKAPFAAVGKFATSDDYRKKIGNKAFNGIRRTAIGTWKALPAVGRGALKLGARTALAATAGVIGAATTGDAEKALGMAAVGFGAGGGAFESTLGRAMKNSKSVQESFGSAVYGSKQDYRNAMADKAFLKSDEFNDYYEKYFKGKKDKDTVKRAFLSYRQAGITDKTTIRKAMLLEDKYRKENNLGEEANRKNIQNIIQTYDMLEKKAFTDERARKEELKRIESQLENVSENNRAAVARQVFKGYEDYRNLG